MVVTQTRRIEKRGIYLFSPEERSAKLFRVWVTVIQTRRGIDENRKILPYRSFYGWVTTMADYYVCNQAQISFQNQLLYEKYQEDTQNHIINSANLNILLQTIGALSLENPAPPNILPYPPPPYLPIVPTPSGLQFVLEEGIIVEVVGEIVPMYVPPEFEYLPQEAPPPGGPGGDKRENPPPVAPPPGGAPTSGLPGSGAPFEISAPYDGVDDDGLTYVPPFIPPWDGDDGQDEEALYTVQLSYQNYTPQGVPDGNVQLQTRTGVPGKIIGLGTLTPNDPDGTYGILTTNPQRRVVNLVSNYQVKIAWPYPEFTSYSLWRIVSVSRQ